MDETNIQMNSSLEYPFHRRGDKHIPISNTGKDDKYRISLALTISMEEICLKHL